MIFVFYKKDGVLRRIIIFPTIKTPEKGVTLVTLVTQGERTGSIWGEVLWGRERREIMDIIMVSIVGEGRKPLRA